MENNGEKRLADQMNKKGQGDTHNAMRVKKTLDFVKNLTFSVNVLSTSDMPIAVKSL